MKNGVAACDNGRGQERSDGAGREGSTDDGPHTGLRESEEGSV